MSRASSLRQRLSKLAAIIKPPNSLAAKLDLLSDDERETYAAWVRICAKWHLRHEVFGPDHAYRALLEGRGPPELPEPIRTKLFGPKPVIPADATLEQVARIYAEYKDSRS